MRYHNIGTSNHRARVPLRKVGDKLHDSAAVAPLEKLSLWSFDLSEKFSLLQIWKQRVESA